MTVYVDDMKARYGRMIICHMIADTDDELHAMADRIGISRRWHQGDHYDICLSKRARVVRHGAIEITMRQLGAMHWRRRHTGTLGSPGDAMDWLRDYQRRRRERASVASLGGGITLNGTTKFDDLDREQLLEKVRELDALVNMPHTADFLESTRLEVAHQIGRWGTVHDRAKEPQDWFWLLGYLSGKALRAHIDGDVQKALHHTISSAAVLANWHAAISASDMRFEPGSSDLQQFLSRTFGDSIKEHSGDANAE